MKIAVAGFGVEGRENLKYFSQFGEVTVVDENPNVDVAGEKAILGEGAYSDMSQFDMVVRTAGLAPRKLKGARKIWSATNEFFAKCPAPIIGVTGTKGKGTTSSFVASILRAAGKKVHLVGNIGLPALSVLGEIKPSDVVVYEMSSFQLWDLEKSPNVAVILMIEPDHLDVHADFEEYIAAKANISRFQQAGDWCIYHPTNQFSSQIAHAGDKNLAKLLRYNHPGQGQVYVKNDHFYWGEAQLCSTKHVRLPGVHNLDNACAAISAALCLDDQILGEQIARGLEDFTGLPHRLKFVREVSGVAFYDDSISTTPGSAIAAVRAFSQPKILILGGSYKGADFTPLVDEVLGADVPALVLIGDEAGRIEAAFRDKFTGEIINLGTETTMQAAVLAAHSQAMPGDVVVLSPSCASFGMFKNYVDRGQQFISAVEALKGE